MNTTIATKPSCVLFALIFAAALSARPAAAQEASESGEAPARQTFDLRFPGGSLEEFVDQVKKAAGSVNIVVDPEAKGILLAPFDVKNVSVPTALEVVSAVLRTPDVRIAAATIIKGHGMPVYAIQAIRTGSPGAAGTRGSMGDAEPMLYRVISIQEITSPPDGGKGGLRAEAALSAIDAAVGLAGGPGAPPVIKYHPETGILIVRGTADQTRLVEEVVINIRNDVRGRTPGSRTSPGGGEKAIVDLEKRLVDAQNEITRLRTAILAGEEYDVDGDGVISDREKRATRK